MAQKTVLVIQDISCVGRCSALVALPVLNAFGHQTALLPTELLSSHTGLASPHRRDLSSDMQAALHNWENLGLSFDAILIGYLSSARQADCALRAVRRYRERHTLLCVDPAMGDHGRLYSGVESAVSEAFAALCAGADLIFPNATEAALLTGRDPRAAKANREALAPLLLLGAKAAVLTGYEEDARIGVLSADGGDVHAALARRRPGAWPGTGDLLAAAITGGVVSGLPLDAACRLAVQFVSDAVHDAAGAPERGVPFEGRLHALWSAVQPYKGA